MSFHRNAHWLQAPMPGDRLGRYVAADDLLVFAPVQVVAGTNVDANGMLSVELCTSAVAPVKTVHGIVMWENPTADFPGLDPVITRSMDVDTAPAGSPVQLCSGDYVRVRYINTEDDEFRYNRTYPGRIMVAGLSIATPTVARGDYLTPGPGNDVSGYWQETSDADLAWLVVSAVYDTGELDCQLTF